MTNNQKFAAFIIVVLLIFAYYSSASANAGGNNGGNNGGNTPVPSWTPLAGEQGYDIDGSDLGPADITNVGVATCGQACLANPQCQAWVIASETGQCLLKSTNVLTNTGNTLRTAGAVCNTSSTPACPATSTFMSKMAGFVGL